jgi:hypothetical protein
MRNTLKILGLTVLGSATTMAHARRCLNINSIDSGLEPEAFGVVCLPATSNLGVALVAVAMLVMLGILIRRRNLAVASRESLPS